MNPNLSSAWQFSLLSPCFDYFIYGVQRTFTCDDYTVLTFLASR